MNSSTTFDPVKAIQAYLPLMHEFAIRSDLVAKALTGNMEFTPPFAREFAYFQFRRMCELIALGGVYIHGNLPGAQQNAFTKEWHAEKLMKLLHKHHAHAFPQPVTRTLEPDGTLNLTANNKPNSLKYSEFRQLYNECGEVLHRGTARTVHISSICTQEAFNKTALWQTKLVTLMDQHSIVSSDDRRMFMFTLRTLETGYPAASIFDIADGRMSESIYNMELADDYINSYISKT
jgi:hypothetical protein